jgi:hypothetical protein
MKLAPRSTLRLLYGFPANPRGDPGHGLSSLAVLNDFRVVTEQLRLGSGKINHRELEQIVREERKNEGGGAPTKFGQR